MKQNWKLSLWGGSGATSFPGMSLNSFDSNSKIICSKASEFSLSTLPVTQPPIRYHKRKSIQTIIRGIRKAWGKWPCWGKTSSWAHQRGTLQRGPFREHTSPAAHNNTEVQVPPIHTSLQPGGRQSKGEPVGEQGERGSPLRDLGRCHSPRQNGTNCVFHPILRMWRIW